MSVSGARSAAMGSPKSRKQPNRQEFNNSNSSNSDCDDELDDNNSQGDDISVMTDLLDNFGPFAARMKEQEDKLEEGQLYLKTKKGLNRKYFIKMVGIDIFFYKESDSEEHEQEHEFMHCLRGIYFKLREPEDLEIEAVPDSGDKVTLKTFPLKIVISSKKARVMYFKSEQDRKKWQELIQNASGSANILKYYDFLEEIGSGQYAVVHLGKHKKGN